MTRPNGRVDKALLIFCYCYPTAITPEENERHE